MRRRSLRVRLSLWHAGLLGLTLLLLSALTLLLLRSVLNSRLDASLREYAETTASTIASTLYQNSVHPRSRPEPFLADHAGRELGRLIQVVDARTGDVLDRSAALAGHRLIPTLDERVRGLKEETTFSTRFDLGEPVRVVTVPVAMGRRIPYLVQTAAPLGDIEEALRRTLLILVVLTPSIFVLSLLGGWLLVGRSLQPVESMTRTALAMEPGRLAHRIEAPGTDDEIAHLASAFNEMMGRLDRSFRQVQQFSADASHELKTPLTAIRGEAEVALMSDLSPEEYRRVLSSIVDEVERMSKIVENLLLLARADADQIQIRHALVPLHDVVLETYEQLEPLARRKGVVLDVGYLDEANVDGERLWLGQVVVNLLNNAIKYTPAGGTVTLALKIVEADTPTAEPQHAAPDRRATHREAVVTVADTGPGIAAEHLPRIFDRFYRVDAG